MYSTQSSMRKRKSSSFAPVGVPVPVDPTATATPASKEAGPEKPKFWLIWLTLAIFLCGIVPLYKALEGVLAHRVPRKFHSC